MRHSLHNAAGLPEGSGTIVPRCITKPWSADGVSDVARCQMPVMFSTIRVSAWPRFLATTRSGTPAMTASDAQL